MNIIAINAIMTLNTLFLTAWSRRRALHVTVRRFPGRCLCAVLSAKVLAAKR